MRGVQFFNLADHCGYSVSISTIPPQQVDSVVHPRKATTFSQKMSGY
jgi:hypothetical protein